MTVPSKRTINKRLKELRALIDTHPDPAVQRVAFAMETAIYWATTDTVNWTTPAREAVILAQYLHQEMKA